MGDPLSAIGAIASVIQLIDATYKVIVTLNEYLTKGEELPSEYIRIKSQLPMLREVLGKSREAIQKGSIGPSGVEAINPCLEGCSTQMGNLEKTLSKVMADANDKFHKKLKKGILSIWRESDVRKIDAEIEFYVNRMTFYFSSATSEFDPRNDKTLSRLQSWLASPDPYFNLNRNLKLRTPETGKWYLESDQYTSWKTAAAASPFTWLYAGPGAGKTILSTSIIEDLKTSCEGDIAKALTFFFFDFQDAEKQNPTNMIKSLLGQILGKCPRIPNEILSIYASCGDGQRQASETQLLDMLKHAVESLPEVFVVVDALDECGCWDSLLEILSDIHGWGAMNVRVLLTSRNEILIRETLEELVCSNNTVCLQSQVVDPDIKTYVHARLINDKAFKRWRNDKAIKEEIEDTLGKKANGMFRWAACQLDVLAKCLTAGKIRKALKDLPKTLDETYSRILLAIDNDENSEEALKILRWLAYADRPLEASEVLEVTGILLDSEPRFDDECKLQEPSDILRICSSFVNTYTGDRYGREYDHRLQDNLGLDEEVEDRVTLKNYVRLAHFSVKEYLVSKRPTPARYCLPEEESHGILASSCIVYLLRFENQEWMDNECDTKFPLARYAAKHWAKHVRISQERSQQQQILTMDILTQRPTAFEAWMRFFDITLHWNSEYSIRRAIDELPSPLYVASHQGLTRAVSMLLADENVDVHREWKRQGNALYAASRWGYKRVVEMLVAKGADVNAIGRASGNALQAASAGGHEKIVKVLLANGADVNAQGGDDGNALQTASVEGHEKIVEILLAKGAKINAQGGLYGNALQAASHGGHKKIVKLLLAKGADVNPQGGYYGNALHAASERGHEKIVEMLLAKGANINAPGAYYVQAYHAFAILSRKPLTIKRDLLANVTDTIAPGRFGTALQIAAKQGQAKTVQLLLAWGADRNVKSFNGALFAASKAAAAEVVKTLLANREYVESEAYALQLAEKRGYKEIVDFLISREKTIGLSSFGL